MNGRLVTGIVALSIAAGCPTYAADMRVSPSAAPAPASVPASVPAWSWTGFYIGANVGFGIDRTDVGPRTFSFSPIFGGPFVDSNIASQSPINAIGGGQVGYNYQSGWAVWGIQADWDASGIRGSALTKLANFFCTCGATTTVRNDWLASVTGRVGTLVYPDTLLYVKGGGAWAEFKQGIPGFFSSGTFVGSYPDVSDNRFGWTAGFGAEYHFNPAWSAFVEGDFYDFGTRTVNFPQLPVPVFGTTFPAFSQDVSERIFVAKVGVNFKFW